MSVNRHLPVESSNIKAIGYDLEEHTLEVIFNTDPVIYRYPDFPVRLYAELLNAVSIGEFFATKIRKVYTTFEKVPLPPSVSTIPTEVQPASRMPGVVRTQCGGRVATGRVTRKEAIEAALQPMVRPEGLADSEPHIVSEPKKDRR